MTEIAGRLHKSRWGIYLALKEAGINTSTGHTLAKRKLTPVNIFLDNEWDEAVHGRSPRNIAELTGLKETTVVSTLRNRRDALSRRAERIATPEFEGFVMFKVDPYLMTVEFHGHKQGRRRRMTLTEAQILKRLV